MLERFRHTQGELQDTQSECTTCTVSKVFLSSVCLGLQQSVAEAPSFRSHSSFQADGPSPPFVSIAFQACVCGADNSRVFSGMVL